MGANKFSQEFSFPIAPDRVFNALIVDKNFMPRLMPEAILSAVIIEGDGGAGSIVQLTFNDPDSYKFVKYKINELDMENFVCKYTLIEGEGLWDKLGSIVYEVKFEASGDGRCICKRTGEYLIKDDEIQAGKDKAEGMYRRVENFFMENPDAFS